MCEKYSKDKTSGQIFKQNTYNNFIYIKTIMCHPKFRYSGLKSKH